MSADSDAALGAAERVARAAGVASLPAGAPEPAIRAAESEVGFAFPDDLRAWYAAHGSGGVRAPEGFYWVMSLEEAVSQWRFGNEFREGNPKDAQEWMPPPQMVDAGVDRSFLMLRNWFPVCSNVRAPRGGRSRARAVAPGSRLTPAQGCGDFMVCDLGNPPPPGRRGQIISYVHDDEQRRVEKRRGRDGFLAWLAHRECYCWSSPT